MKESGLENDLRGIVGDRVTTSEFERWFYTGDILHIPRAIRALWSRAQAGWDSAGLDGPVAMSIASIMDKILPTRAGKVEAGKREGDRVS